MQPKVKGRFVESPVTILIEAGIFVVVLFFLLALLSLI